MSAGRSGHLSVVKTAGADVTTRDIGGCSALDNAVCNGHIDVIGALLRHGADVNACDDFTLLLKTIRPVRLVR
ncbi:unnamed protein product [Ectocarpus sp. 8 AP-2014]